MAIVLFLDKSFLSELTLLLDRMKMELAVGLLYLRRERVVWTFVSLCYVRLSIAFIFLKFDSLCFVMLANENSF